jgi:hypothetical protein
MIEERRKHKREILFFYTRVFDANSNDLLGHLGDITNTGAMIIGALELPTGQEYTLRIELPIGEFEKDYMELKAISRWSEPDVDPHMFNTGFKFTKIDKADAAIINEIVEAHALRKGRKQP